METMDRRKIKREIIDIEQVAELKWIGSAPNRKNWTALRKLIQES